MAQALPARLAQMTSIVPGTAQRMPAPQIVAPQRLVPWKMPARVMMDLQRRTITWFEAAVLSLRHIYVHDTFLQVCLLVCLERAVTIFGCGLVQ